MSKQIWKKMQCITSFKNDFWFLQSQECFANAWYFSTSITGDLIINNEYISGRLIS